MPSISRSGRLHSCSRSQAVKCITLILILTGESAWTDLHATLQEMNGGKMSIEELIRKDPYTVVKHFDRRIQTLFDEVLRINDPLS